MRINLNSNINPTFGIIELKSEDRVKSQALINEIIQSTTISAEKDKSAIQLYRVFEPYIRDEGRYKATRRYPLEDVISDIKVRFWEFIYEITPKNTVDNLVKQINEFKPYTSSLKPYQEGKNLDEEISGTKKLHYIDLITKENLPIPQSEVEIEKAKKQLKTEIQKTRMTTKTKKRLKQRGKGLTYSKIAEKDGVLKQTVANSVKRGVLLVQSRTGAISKENKQSISNVAKTLGITFDEALNIALKYVEILSLNPETINKNIESSANLFGINTLDFVKIASKQPTLFGFKPETLDKNIKMSTQLLGISRKDFIQAGLKFPNLFYLSPETINKNIENSAKLFGVSGSDFVNTALKSPTLFYMKSETLNKNIESSAKLLGITKSDFIKAAFKSPQLFYQKPVTLNENVESLIKLTGLEKSVYVKSALKFPGLFHYKSETLNKNMESSAKLLGLTKLDFIKAALKFPQLFYQKPETLNKNIESSARLLNFSKKEFLAEALIHPQLFYLKPEGLYRKTQVMHYCNKIKNKNDSIKLSGLTHKSETQLYKEILLHLIYTHKTFSKLTKTQIETKLSELINSCQNIITFTIPADDVADGFIKYAQEYSIKTAGKNIFKFIMKK